MITQTYNLNLVPNDNQVIVNASQYDEGSRRIEFILYHGRDLFDINDYEQKNNVICNVRVLGTKADGTGYMYDCGFSHSKVFFDIQEQMTVLAGQHTAEIRIVDNEDNIIGSSNFIFQIEKAALKDDTVISETDIPLLQRILNNIDSINAVETMLDGGTTGQVLAKKSDADGDVEWEDIAGGNAKWGSISGTLSDQADLKQALDSKVNMVEGKGLSTNDYTTEEKNKLAGLSNYDDTEIKGLIDQKADSDDVPTKVSQLQNDSGFITKEVDDLTNYRTSAIQDVIDSGKATTTQINNLQSQIDLKENTSNKVTSITASSTDTQYPSAKAVYDELNNKVDKVSGKGLSTNDFTNADKTKLDGIESGAEVNVIDKILVNGIEQPITNKTVDIKVNPTIYGIKRSLSTSSSVWERTDNAVGLVANATKDGSEVQNDFDSIYPWSDIITYNYDTTNKVITAYLGDINFAFDGSNGEVLTRIPEFYYRRSRDSEYEYIQITKFATDGFIKSPAFSVGRYGSYYDGNKIHSYSGYCPEVQRNISSFRTLSMAVGDGFCQLDYHYFLLQILYLVEYADYNSQSRLGSGISSMRINANDKALVSETSVNRIVINETSGDYFIVGQQISIGARGIENWSVARNRTITSKEPYDDGNVTGTAIYFDGAAVNIAVGNVIWSHGQMAGQCDSLGMRSGCLSNDGKHGVIYRGIENLFGNVYEWVDGINIKDYQAYICFSPEDYVCDVFDEPYKAIGFVNADSSGYAKAVGFDENNTAITLISEIGGSNNTYLCDYYSSATGNKVARCGGNYSDGTRVGLWTWVMSSASTFAYYTVGSRLIRYQD